MVHRYHFQSSRRLQIKPATRPLGVFTTSRSWESMAKIEPLTFSADEPNPRRPDSPGSVIPGGTDELADQRGESLLGFHDHIGVARQAGRKYRLRALPRLVMSCLPEAPPIDLLGLPPGNMEVG